MNMVGAETPLAGVTVVLNNVRSLYNVGAIMRACDGVGVRRLMMCGITPYPLQGAADTRRGPVAARADREIRKTALAAVTSVRVEVYATAADAITRLKEEGASVAAVERTPRAQTLWRASILAAPRLALILGNEVNGLDNVVLGLVDAAVEIPMLGAGTSLNVASAAAIVLYEVLRRHTRSDAGF